MMQWLFFPTCLKMCIHLLVRWKCPQKGIEMMYPRIVYPQNWQSILLYIMQGLIFFHNCECTIKMCIHLLVRWNIPLNSIRKTCCVNVGNLCCLTLCKDCFLTITNVLTKCAFIYLCDENTPSKNVNYQTNLIVTPFVNDTTKLFITLAHNF